MNMDELSVAMRRHRRHGKRYLRSLCRSRKFWPDEWGPNEDFFEAWRRSNLAGLHSKNWRLEIASGKRQNRLRQNRDIWNCERQWKTVKDSERDQHGDSWAAPDAVFDVPEMSACMSTCICKFFKSRAQSTVTRQVKQVREQIRFALFRQAWR